MGLIPLLRRLGGAKDRDDREALWEAAETYHRLHQVPQLLLVEQPPPPPLLSQVELCSGSGGGAVYGLALALTSLNLARRGLARPRVKVNITFYSKLTSSPIINLRRRSTFCWPPVSVSPGHVFPSCSNAELSCPPPRWPRSRRWTESLPGWLVTMGGSSSSTTRGDSQDLHRRRKNPGVSPLLRLLCSRSARWWACSSSSSSRCSCNCSCSCSSIVVKLQSIVS